MQTKLLYLFTRTPLHVGAGSSVGAIDQPIVRERHTGFPIIPGSSIKGSLADQWPTTFRNEKDQLSRLRTHKDENKKIVVDEVSEAAWLFGSDEAGDSLAAAGALLFGEARLLAFPLRSARGSFAWITSPLILRRAARDGVIAATDIPNFPADKDADAKTLFAKAGPLALPGDKIVLEEYTFSHVGGDDTKLASLGGLLTELLDKDPVWAEVATRLVILSDGQLSHFVTTACEVAQHVRINDETGTAAPHGLFNQENVPSETLFYAVVRATGSRLKGAAFAGQNITYQPLTPPGQPTPPPVTKLAVDLTDAEALAAFEAKLVETKVFQFGADASTGLGYCTAKLGEPKGA